MTVVAIVNQKGGVGKTTLVRTGIMLLVNAGPRAVPVTGTTSTSPAPMACLCNAIQPARAVPTRFHAYPTRLPCPD